MQMRVSQYIKQTGEGWERIMEVIAKAVSPSLTYIGQFQVQLYAAKSFETVKNSDG